MLCYVLYCILYQFDIDLYCMCESIIYFILHEVLYFVFVSVFFCRLSTKSLLNLATKIVPGHVLKHGYVNFFIYIFVISEFNE